MKSLNTKGREGGSHSCKLVCNCRLGDEKIGAAYHVALYAVKKSQSHSENFIMLAKSTIHACVGLQNLCPSHQCIVSFFIVQM